MLSWGDVMSNLSIRGLDSAALSTLKLLASQQGASVNTLVLRLIDQGLGKVPGKPEKRRFDDLDSLAGAWDDVEAAEFAANTEGFDKVDLDQWK